METSIKPVALAIISIPMRTIPQTMPVLLLTFMDMLIYAGYTKSSYMCGSLALKAMPIQCYTKHLSESRYIYNYLRC